MKVSLANTLKTGLEKMSVFASEQKLMKTQELFDSEQKLIITKGLIRRRGRKQSGERRFRCAESPFHAHIIKRTSLANPRRSYPIHNPEAGAANCAEIVG